MSNAWIALSLAPAVILVGCNSEPETVAQVPPPNYAAQPEPLPPVSINEGTSSGSFREGPGISSDPGESFDLEPLAPQPPANRTYTIRKGDTLWSIAKREYGNGQRWKEIAQANPSVDPKKMLIGQQVVLP